MAHSPEPPMKTDPVVVAGARSRGGTPTYL